MELSGSSGNGVQVRVAGYPRLKVIGRRRQFRRRGHPTIDPRPDQCPRQPEPGRAGLIGHRYRGRQPPDPFQDFSVIWAQPALEHLTGVPVQPTPNH